MFNYDIFFDDGSKVTITADRCAMGQKNGPILFYLGEIVVTTIWTHKVNAMIRRKESNYV